MIDYGGSTHAASGMHVCCNLKARKGRYSLTRVSKLLFSLLLIDQAILIRYIFLVFLVGVWLWGNVVVLGRFRPWQRLQI